jgi:hypothetical protein
MRKNRNHQPKRSYLTGLLIVLIIAIALFLLKNSIFDNKKNVAIEDTANQTKTNMSPPHKAGQTTTPATDHIQPPATAESSPPMPPSLDTTPPASTPCKKITANLQEFCEHLEKQDYIKAYSLNEPIQTSLNTIITKLLNNPPVNVGETADLLTVLKNAAHLYRTLGPKDLSLLKDILVHEHASLERQLASLYDWSVMDKACRDNSTIKFQLPLSKTYEYAAFFLNTLGGRSYLSRRDPEVRVLTKYYCVLIINQAIQQSMNKYNINLPYHLEAVTKEISDSDFLADQDLYLETLKKIKAGLR